MTMAAAIRTGRLLPGGSKGNRFRSRSGGRRVRAGRALLWLLGLSLVVVLVAAVSLGLLMGFRWLTVSPFFALSEIEVTGNVRLTAEEVVSLAGVDLGANTLELRIADVERRVAADPWARSVAVRRVLPGGLAIRVEERAPVYWVRTGSGLSYAEADGSVIAPVSADRFTACPLLDAAPAEDLSGLGGRLAGLDGAGLPVRAAQAAWIKVRHGGLELYFEDRALSLLVSDEGWDGNMRRLSLVWEDLARRGEASRVREIRVLGGKVWVRT